MKTTPSVSRTSVPTGAHFSKAFLATIPPFNPATQTDTDDYDAAAAFFARVERNIYGGFSGLMALHHHARKYDVLPNGVSVLAVEVEK